MRNGFGEGVSIPSQLRWVGYVDYWTQHEKHYVERAVEIVEIHAWGLREGVKVCVQGYVEEGKKIKTFHTFSSDERLIVDSTIVPDQSLATKLSRWMEPNTQTAEATKIATALEPVARAESPSLINTEHVPTQPKKSSRKGSEPGGNAVVLRPASKVVVSSSDVCIDLERRNKAPYGGWTLVTAVAHVWFNVFFEGRKTLASDASAGSKSEPATDRGVFEIEWDAMDGIKGSSRKGVRAVDKIAVVWRAIGDEVDGQAKIVEVPKVGEPVPEAKPADWAGVDVKDQDDNPNKDIGMRLETPASANVSKASSIKSAGDDKTEKTKESEPSDYDDSLKGVKSHGIDSAEDPAVVQ